MCKYGVFLMSIIYSVSQASPINAVAGNYARYTLLSNLAFFGKSALFIVSSVLIAAASIYLFCAFLVAVGVYNISFLNSNKKHTNFRTPHSSLFHVPQSKNNSSNVSLGFSFK